VSARPVQTSNPRAAAERFVIVRALPLSATNIARWIREAPRGG
jgi:hypothetical protein